MSLKPMETSKPDVTKVLKYQSCMGGTRCRVGSVRALLLFLVTCIFIALHNAGGVHVMRHLADSRYKNFCDGVISRMHD